jgi:hypothetical protein
MSKAQMSKAMQIVGNAPQVEAGQSALERLEVENAKLRRIASEVMFEIEALRRVR